MLKALYNSNGIKHKVFENSPQKSNIFQGKKKLNFPPKKYSNLPTYLNNKKRLSKVILLHCFEPFSWYGNHCWDTCCLKLALQSKIFQIGLLGFLAHATYMGSILGRSLPKTTFSIFGHGKVY